MVEVVCAIILNSEGKVLVTQRSERMKLPLKIEFPGGKVEPGEAPETALIREIREELNLDILIRFPMPSNEHHYADFSIRLIPFVCSVVGGILELKEHAACWWLYSSELSGLDWAEADIPVLKKFLAAV